MNHDAVAAAADHVRSASGRDRHDVAIVLGSGLSGHAATLPDAVEVPYDEIPGFPVPRVEGHAGTLVSADLGVGRLLAFAGRVHTYEGWAMDDVVFGVRTAIAAGCHTVVLTNAAGGCGDGLAPGDLVLIRDHLNLTGRNPLTGPNDERFGPRFPDMTDVYTERLRHVAREVAADTGVGLGEGVYAWFLGPSYETPAEVEMARRLGADLVGMSTVPEAIAARHMGASVVGISLVTNLAAGISPVPLSHDEVTETAAAARDRFTALVDALLPRLVAAGGA
ncbi:MAG: purine-nucleoside phosphorylase [Acidimicrobiia bacterium]|nr:purine-nucleoside phosphorylase [Acidimicrobiia bacterium]